MSTKKVGFIGLGAMGLGMASCLVKAEFSVTGFDINHEAMAEFTKSGGRPANTHRDTATEADILVIVVATSGQASSVLFDNGVLATLPENTVILLCITSSPDYVLSLESRMKENNRPDVRLIDCPISGGEVRAREGTLSLLCAGKETDIAYVRDVLNCFASHVHTIPGGVGAGSSVKMVHQILVGVHILASVEVMGLAYVAGLDLQSTYDAVMKEDGASWLFGQRAAHILDENRVPASSLMIITKDFAMIEACMRRNQVNLPLASLAYQLFIQASSAGWDDDDCNAVNLYLLGRGTIQSLRKPPPLTKPPLINESDITNLMIGIHTAAAVEVLQFAKRLDLDIDVVKQVVQDAAGSSVMFNKVHSQLREKTEISLKSLNNYELISQRLATAFETAKPAGYPLFLASAALQQFYNPSEHKLTLDLTTLYIGKRKSKMGVYHIVLLKLKHDYEKPLLEHWKQQVYNLVGVIPGLKYVDVGAPLPATADRAKGFNVSLVAVLEKPEDALVYAEHPEHEKLIRECRPRLFEEVLVCDMPFQER